MEDFWLIVVTEGNEDETEINELSVIKTNGTVERVS